jgi:hypothetical protein
MADIELIPIIAPELENSSYGQGVATQFDNIDRNFKLLANRDFVRGKAGTSIKAKNYQLVKPASGESVEEDWTDDEKISKWLYVQIRDIIDTAVPEDNPWPVAWKTSSETNPYNVCYSTLEDSYVIVYYQEAEDGSVEEFIGIQPYPFIDGRLSVAEYRASSESSELTIRPDLTCVVVTTFDETENTTEFERLSVFPTIYYDSSVGDFCWKIDGNNTGIVAKGPKGQDGQNGYIVIAKINTAGSSVSINNNTYYKVSEILDTYENNGWIPAVEGSDNKILKSIPEYSDENGHYVTAFAFDNNVDKGPFISYIFHTNGGDGVESGYYTSADDFAKLNLEAAKFSFSWWMKNLYYQNPVNGDTSTDIYQRGLFVPFVKGMNNVLGAHIMYAVDNTVNNTTYTGRKLVFAPVVSINDVSGDTRFSRPTIDPNGTLEVRYKNINFIGGKTDGSAVNISDRSVQTVFDSLYLTRDQVSSEKRFAYIWKSTPTSGTFPEPDSTENRPTASTFANNIPSAYICNDGFLWYRDPYSYLKIKIEANGKVSITGPTNGDVATGNVTFSQNPIVIEANAQSTNATIETDAYWDIN